MNKLKTFETFIQTQREKEKPKDLKSTYEYNVDNIKLIERPSNFSYKQYDILDLNDNKLGRFSVAKEGDILIDEDGHFTEEEIKENRFDIEHIYPNSAYWCGGFASASISGSSYTDNRGKGIGSAAVKKYFIENPTIENVFLYAVPWQGAIPFWHKIGGVSILKVESKNKELHYIQLKRNKILKS